MQETFHSDGREGQSVSAKKNMPRRATETLKVWEDYNHFREHFVKTLQFAEMISGTKVEESKAAELTDLAKKYTALLKGLADKQSMMHLKLNAAHNEIFPPASPSSKRRRRNGFMPDFVYLVAGILSTAEKGAMNDFLNTKIIEACQNFDVDFFRGMADATEHIQGITTHPYSTHSKHVIALQKEAIKVMMNNQIPTKSELKKIVTNQLGNAAFPSEQAWSEAFKDAKLGHLRARPPAKKAAKVRGKTR
jgi:hypothetical protein